MVMESGSGASILRTIGDRSFLSQAVIFTCNTGRNGSITFVSQNFTEQFGYQASELLQESDFWSRRIHPDDRIRVLSGSELLFRRGWHAQEYRFLLKEGIYRWIYDERTLLPGAGGQPHEIMGYWIDITARKQAHETLHLLRDLSQRWRVERPLPTNDQPLQRMVEELAVGIWGLDSRGQTTFVSPGLTKMLGYRREEMLGRPFSDFVDTSQADPIRQWLAMAREDTPCQSDLKLTRKDGSAVWAIGSVDQSSSAPRSSEGFFMAITDVTERRQSQAEEDRLRHHHYQDQRLESLTALASGIAHQFNNLLTAILGYSDMALEGLEPGSFEHASIERVVKASKRAEEVARQMLIFTGRMPCTFGDVQLSRMIAGMEADLRATTSDRCALRSSLAEGLPLIQADSEYLRRLILNLVTNASEAIGNKTGIISLTTGVLNCDRHFLSECQVGRDRPPGTYVSLSIVDSGCGMTREVLSRAFDPYFTTKFIGRGVGLAEVHGIINSHRGAINVSSEPGRGSTFRLLFLARSSSIEATPPEQQGALESRGGSRTILVVEDDDTIGLIAEGTLEMAGYQVVSARSRQAAIEALNGKPQSIDAVLLDLTKPEMNAAQLLQELRRLRPDLPVLLSGTSPHQLDQTPFAHDGAAGFIQKPYQVKQLVEAVRRIIRS